MYGDDPGVCCYWQAYPRRQRHAGETKPPFSCDASRSNSQKLKLLRNTSNKIDFMRKQGHVETNHENNMCVHKINKACKLVLVTTTATIPTSCMKIVESEKQVKQEGLAFHFFFSCLIFDCLSVVGGRKELKRFRLGGNFYPPVLLHHHRPRRLL